MELTTKQKLYLKSKAHDIKPVVMIGQKGITDSVIEEIKSSIDHHELIKVKIAGQEKEVREAVAAELAEKADMTIVQIMGNTVTFFKQKKQESSFSLPKAKNQELQYRKRQTLTASVRCSGKAPVF